MSREVRHITVTPEESGQKITAFIARRLGEHVPPSAVMRWIRTGQVRLDGGRTRPFVRVAEGQVVRLPPCETREVPVQGRLATPPFAVIYEDGSLLAIDKPAGLPVHPGSGWADSVVTRLEAAYPGASFAPTPAHRLDRDTTGILLIAKTYEKLAELNRLFRQGGIKKEYLAWVSGRLPGESGALQVYADRLEKSGPDGREKVRSGSGKDAVSEVVILAAKSRATLVRVRIRTGRTHQIRVQLASRGHPLIGDGKYGDPRAHPGQKLKLHCWRLSLPDIILAWPPGWDGDFSASGCLPKR